MDTTPLQSNAILATESHNYVGDRNKQSAKEALFLVDEFCRTQLPPNFKTKGPQRCREFDGPRGKVCLGSHRTLDRDFVTSSALGKRLKQRIGDYLDFTALTLGFKPDDTLWKIVWTRNEQTQDRIYKRDRVFSHKDFADGGSADVEVAERSQDIMQPHPQRVSLISAVKDAAPSVNPQALAATIQEPAVTAQVPTQILTAKSKEEKNTLKWENVILAIDISDCSSTWNELRFHFSWLTASGKSECRPKNFQIGLLKTQLEADEDLKNVTLNTMVFYHKELAKAYRLVQNDIIFMFLDLVTANLLDADRPEIKVKLMSKSAASASVDAEPSKNLPTDQPTGSTGNILNTAISKRKEGPKENTVVVKEENEPKKKKLRMRPDGKVG